MVLLQGKAALRSAGLRPGAMEVRRLFRFDLIIEPGRSATSESPPTVRTPPDGRRLRFVLRRKCGEAPYDKILGHRIR
jgi:hypothetical protein